MSLPTFAACLPYRLVLVTSVESGRRAARAPRTNTRPHARTHARMAESGLPSTHGEFLKAFVEVAGEGKGTKSHDGNDAGVSKRQRLLTGKEQITGVMTAPVARYGLGGDDNLYLQLGLSVLHTASSERALAPAALYSVDVVHAIREGIQRNVLAELKRRNQESEAKLEQVRSRLVTIFGVMGLNDMVEDPDQMSTVLNTPYKKNKRDEFKDLLYRLLDLLICPKITLIEPLINPLQ